MSNFKALLISLLLFPSLFTHTSPVFASPFRPDPLHHFRFYKGGYDIRNKHYWASAAFTGVHGYAIAGIWMIFGLGFGSYLVVRSFNGGFQPFLDHPSSYFLACFALTAMFILIAIIFSSLILVANQSSLHKSKTLMDTIFGAASNMQQTIEAVMQGFLKIRTLLQPYDRQTSELLNQITNQMRKETISIQSFVGEARQASNRAMKTVYITNLVFVTANLVVLVTGCGEISFCIIF
ncbi:putative transmembrane protein [Helianthus debilis subsp. tardiflorus]